MKFSSFVRMHWAAFRALLVMTVITGLAYPAFVWLVAQLPGLHDQAEGSILTANGKPVGSRLIGYGRLDRGRGGSAAIGVIALTVLAAYRRKGIGEALMRVLLHSAGQEPSVRDVWLAVRPENTPAIHLYRKLNFRREAKHPLGDLAAPGEITMVWAPTPAATLAGR